MQMSFQHMQMRSGVIKVSGRLCETQAVCSQIIIIFGCYLKLLKERREMPWISSCNFAFERRNCCFQWNAVSVECDARYPRWHNAKKSFAYRNEPAMNVSSSSNVQVDGWIIKWWILFQVQSHRHLRRFGWVDSSSFSKCGNAAR